MRNSDVEYSVSPLSKCWSYSISRRATRVVTMQCDASTAYPASVLRHGGLGICTGNERFQEFLWDGGWRCGQQTAQLVCAKG